MNPIEERITKTLAKVGAELTADVADKVVKLCGIKGLTADDVLQGKTPEGIVRLWMHRRMSTPDLQGNRTECTDELDNRSHPLLPFSRVVHDAMRSNPNAADVWTFPVLLRAKASDMNAGRLRDAVDKVVAHHPVFSMRIADNGTQRYEKDYRTPYLNTDVYTEGGYVYLSLSINRILGDASSFVLFMQNIWRAYRGEELLQDGYLRYLQQYEKVTQSLQYREHAEWLVLQYGNPSCPLLPKQDSPEGALPLDGTYSPYCATPTYADKLSELHRKKGISINAFFCLATTMAIMDYNGTNKAGLTWAYLGRETLDEMGVFGSLHRDIPMIITKTTITNDGSSSTDHSFLLLQLRQQIEQGILHSDYPFTLHSPADSPWHAAVNVLVQPSLAEAMEGCPADFELVAQEGSGESYCMLDIDITSEPLTLTFNYSPRHYTSASIQRFAELIERNAEELLEYYI